MKKRHTRTSVLERAVDPAFQGHPRRRKERCFCEILFSLVLDFLLRREPRLPPPDKDVVCANLDGNSNAKFMGDQQRNTHRSVLRELEGKENDYDGKGESRVESRSQDVWYHISIAGVRNGDIKTYNYIWSTMRNGAYI